MPQSNDLGRTLEYAIVDAIVLHHDKSKIKYTTRLANNQRRDKISFLRLPKSTQIQHKRYALAVYDWLNEDFDISHKNISIDRMSDIDAINGDVTDIKISIDGVIINLSVKHNHSALKHQRPPTTAVRCGFASGSKQDIEFRRELSKITTEFIANTTKKFPKATLFRDIKSQFTNYIDTRLYLPICTLVSNFINKNVNKSNAPILFDFLVGNTEFYKITASKNQITIEEFAKLEKPKTVSAIVKGNSYVILKFSNGWDISMRLHTASSRIGKSPSLKFDTQLLNSSIPKRVIECRDIN